MTSWCLQYSCLLFLSVAFMFHEHYFFSAPVLWLLHTNYSASHSLRGLNSAIFSHSRWHHITVLLECNVDIPELDIDTEALLLIASVSLSFMETQLLIPHPPPFDVGKNAEKTFWSYNSRDQIPYFDISHLCVSAWGNVPTIHRLSRRECVDNGLQRIINELCLTEK